MPFKLLGITLALQILSLLLFLSPMLPPLAPSPLLRPYPFPLPLLRNSSLFLDALSFLLLRALLAFALICNESLCCSSLFLEMSNRPCRQDERRQSNLCSQQDNHRGFIQNERDRPSFRSQHGRLTCGNDEQGRRRSRSRDSEVGSQYERWRDGPSYAIQTRPADFATSAAAGCGTQHVTHYTSL